MSTNQGNKIVIQVLIAIFFMVLLVIPMFLKKNIVSPPHENKYSNAKMALEYFGFYLTDVTEKSGIQFIHKSPQLDPKLDHILPQIASMGASVSVVDFDNDGWDDLYFTNSRIGEMNALYHNEQDGSFKDVAGETGIADVNGQGSGVSMGAIWGDYDNDGFEDLFVYKWGKPELFHNENGNGFRNATAEAGLPEWVNSNTALWLDFDNDGLLDLFIGGYFRHDINLWELVSTVIMPESFEYANNGGRNYLFLNKGDGVFEDITEQAGLSSTRWTLAAGAGDLNNDGFTDIVIANDYGNDELFINESGEKFKEIGKDAGIGFTPKSGMNMAFGDVSNTRHQSLYISNITEMGILLQGNNLWKPKGPKKGTTFPKYSNIARPSGVELGGWSYGAQFGDLNNDGSLDLYVANGFISGIKGSSYWYDYSKVTGGNKAIISDAVNWPAMEGKSQSGYQQNMVWLNDGNGNFLDASFDVCNPAALDSRSVVMADLWNRGVLDVVVANQNNQPLVYRNEVDPENHWIAFKLEGAESNKSAIGAMVSLYWNDVLQSQIITGGIGFCSQNQRGIHFGLGKNQDVDKVEIKWPSGRVQIIEKPATGKIHKVVESI